MDTPDPLFNLHRVPGEIVVDERIGELQVAAFASRLRAEHDRHALAKGGDGVVLFVSRLVAGKHRKRQPVPPQQCLEMGQRAAKVDEDQQLVSVRLLDQFQQTSVLGGMIDRFGQMREIPASGSTAAIRCSEAAMATG